MSLHKTPIEWATHTWNPVTGCMHGCRYCYARGIAKRFGPKATEHLVESTDFTKDGECYILHKPTRQEDAGGHGRTSPYPFGFSPTLFEYKLNLPERCKTPARIFVCSMADLFGEWVPDEWIKRVFDACRRAPQHKYLFLTKNPDRYIRMDREGKLPVLDNFWYGSTVTDPDMTFYWSERQNTFASIEPLLAPFEEDPSHNGIGLVKWAIIGAETGPGASRHRPKREWVEAIVNTARREGVPVYMKDSLVPIMGEANMLRQFPRGLQHG